MVKSKRGSKRSVSKSRSKSPKFKRSRSKSPTKRSRSKTRSKSPSGRSGKNVEIKVSGKDLELYHNDKKLPSDKSIWVSVTSKRGMVYISRGKLGRSYWVLGAILKSKLPRISFNDQGQTIKFSSYRMVINNRNKYQRIKDILNYFLNLDDSLKTIG